MIVTMSQYNIVSVYELKKVNYEAEVLLHIACLFTFGSCLPTFVFNGVGGGLPRLLTLMERPPFLLGLHFAIHFGSWEVLLHIACLFTSCCCFAFALSSGWIHWNLLAGFASNLSDRRYHGYLLHMIFTSFNHFELLVVIRDQSSR